VARHQIVIARYNEDIGWAEGLPAVVYNKGTSLDTRLETRPLANVGRESHTYLHHIVHHWDELADVTLFAQGRTADHFPPGVELGHFFDPAHELVVPRVVNCHEWDDRGRLKHWGVWKDRFDAGKLAPARLPMTDWFREYVGIDPVADGSLVYSPGAIFSVTRDLIRRRERVYYERLLTTVAHHVDPEEAYYMERAWLYMFARPTATVRYLSA
jgi:hypothetical protein